MKKLILLAAVLIVGVASVFANDGTFYVSGNNLIPLQETRVSLRKEVLKFFIRDYNWMNVEVDFDFYNPGPARTITVGFVTPPAMGDVAENEHPRIKGFTVVVNGDSVPFKMKRMSETTFSKARLKISGDDYVYYFPVTFKPGLNKVRHTYEFEGGASVELQRSFDYQITTGKRWANRQIDGSAACRQ